MKTILVILASLFLSFSALADLSVSIYTAPTGSGKTTSQGCSYVSFTLSGFTGSIGGASFSNLSVGPLPVPSSFQGGAGQRLSAIPYTVTSGTLIITEVK